MGLQDRFQGIYTPNTDFNADLPAEETLSLSEFIKSKTDDDFSDILSDDYFLGLSSLLEYDDGNNTIYIYDSGDVYLETSDGFSCFVKTLDEEQMAQLKNNIFELRGVSFDSPLKSLCFRYDNILVSAIFNGNSEFFTLKNSCSSDANNSMLSSFLLLNANILITGSGFSPVSDCLVALSDMFDFAGVNRRAVLLQHSKMYNPDDNCVIALQTEFIRDRNEFSSVFDNVLRFKPDFMFVDEIQNEFLPYVITNLSNACCYSRVYMRSEDVDDCVEKLTGVYAKELNLYPIKARERLFSKFDIILELKNSCGNISDISFDIYIVNKEDGIKFDKVEDTSPAGISELLARFSDNSGLKSRYNN